MQYTVRESDSHNAMWSVQWHRYSVATQVDGPTMWSIGEKMTLDIPAGCELRLQARRIFMNGVEVP
jgi:hypothetical protein